MATEFTSPPELPAEISVNPETIIGLRQTALQILHDSQFIAGVAGWAVEQRDAANVTLGHRKNYELYGRLSICHDPAAGVAASYWQVIPYEDTATVHESSVLLRNGATSRQLEREYRSLRLARGGLLPEPLYRPGQAYEVLADETLTDELSAPSAYEWQVALTGFAATVQAGRNQPPALSRRGRTSQTLLRILRLA